MRDFLGKFIGIICALTAAILAITQLISAVKSLRKHIGSTGSDNNHRDVTDVEEIREEIRGT